MTRKQSDVTRRRVLQGTAAVAAGALLPHRAFASNPTPQPTPTTGGNGGTFTVTLSDTQTGFIPPQFVGLSLEKWYLNNAYLSSANTTLTKLLNGLGGAAGGVLRMGGNSTDQTVYEPTGSTTTYDVKPYITPGAITNLAGFLHTLTGWSCIYGINLQGAGNPPLNTGVQATTTTLAQEETARVASAFAAFSPAVTLLGYELGNEPDNWGNSYSYSSYSNEGDTWEAHPWYGYEQEWNAYATAIGITASWFAGPAAADNAGTWGESFGTYVQALAMKPASFLATQHFYIENETAGTLDNLIYWSSPTSSYTPNVSSLTASYLGNPNVTPQVPGMQSYAANNSAMFRMGETNTYYDGGKAGLSDAYISALWVLDYLFALATSAGTTSYGCSGANFHGGGNVGSGAYAPLYDNGNTTTLPTAVLVVNPIFYGLQFFNLALGYSTANCKVITVSNGFGSSGLVTAYCVVTASSGSTSSLSIIIVNKDASNYYEPTIDLPWQLYLSSIPNLIQLSPTSTSVTLTTTNITGTNTYTPAIGFTGYSGTSTIPIGSTFTPPTGYWPTYVSGSSSTITCYVPAMSAILIKCKVYGTL